MAADNRVLQFFPQGLRGDWERSAVRFDQVQEIRLRVNQPVRVLSDREHRLPIIYGEREMEDIFRYLCHDSVYAYEEERPGYPLPFDLPLLPFSEQFQYILSIPQYMSQILKYEHLPQIKILFHKKIPQSPVSPLHTRLCDIYLVLHPVRSRSAAPSTSTAGSPAAPALCSGSLRHTDASCQICCRISPPPRSQPSV